MMLSISKMTPATTSRWAATTSDLIPTWNSTCTHSSTVSSSSTVPQASSSSRGAFMNPSLSISPSVSQLLTWTWKICSSLGSEKTAKEWFICSGSHVLMAPVVLPHCPQATNHIFICVFPPSGSTINDTWWGCSDCIYFYYNLSASTLKRWCCVNNKSLFLLGFFIGVVFTCCVLLSAQAKWTTSTIRSCCFFKHTINWVERHSKGSECTTVRAFTLCSLKIKHILLLGSSLSWDLTGSKPFLYDWWWDFCTLSWDKSFFQTSPLSFV